MTSSSDKYRYAYHVAPLHALKSICLRRSLLSKASMGENGTRRVSTSRVDELLGFYDYIHFYLPRQTELDFSGLRILQAQLCESSAPAFPHFVIAIDTKNLQDEECTICNFNIAVSRPAYPGIKGGNHTRGMAPEKILEHWKGFRASNPTDNKLRQCFWHDGLAVPVLKGKQITASPNSVGVGTEMPELLILKQYSFRPTDAFYLFSDFDHATVRALPGDWEVELTESTSFGWYASADRVPKDARMEIEAYFKNANAIFPAHLNFDQVRPRSKNEGGASKVLKVKVPLS